MFIKINDMLVNSHWIHLVRKTIPDAYGECAMVFQMYDGSTVTTTFKTWQQRDAAFDEVVKMLK